MKRRQALKGIGGLSIGVFLFQSCQSEPTIALENIKLNKGDWTSILHFSQMILPVVDQEGVRGDERVAYVLKTLDQTFKPETRSLFIQGLASIRKSIEEKHNANPSEMGAVPLIDFWKAYTGKSLSNSDDMPESVFLETTKQLLIQDFTTSKSFLNDRMGYKFLPGEYVGCVNVETI